MTASGGTRTSAHTPAGSTFPTDTGYATASWLGAAAMGVTVVAALTLRRAPDSTTTGPADLPESSRPAKGHRAV
ncbi:hypothetical protein [Streptomyces decoyicus]|uniref:hypothetical protein n=1 Tax=Streptomyces decoyicus TaxID=249567 RepID=UPI0033B488BB